MKRGYYSLVLFFCMFIFPTFVHAECSYERTAELSRIASNVQLSYNYRLEYGLEYDVHITNLTNDVYAMDNFGNVFTGNTDITKHYSYFDNITFTADEPINYNIYSNDDNCKGEYLLKKYINFPNYNVNSSSEDCKKYPDFKYCQVWSSNIGISPEKFKMELNKFINSNNLKEEKAKANDSDDIFKYINSNVLILVSILLLISGIYFIRRKMVKI